MPQYEGYVNSIHKDGNAEVLILPEGARIPGAPQLNSRHAPSESSRITIQALNRPGAAQGDLVSVRLEAGVLIRNAARLLGIPLLGLTLGIAGGGVLTRTLAIQPQGILLLAAVGLLIGATTGVIAYKRTSPRNKPVITHIIGKGAVDLGALCEFPAGLEGTKGSRCSGCDACF